ncbi:MAG: hypothetical protein GEU96_15265 [Propionibacteriales bacterium]|nr:hypothetical protein [Propionibacteriales bacterium]
MTNGPKPSKAQKLLAAADEAAQLRAYRTHPDVAALAIERVRTRVDVLVWTGLVLGLLFTMSNVASFAARGADVGSVAWVIAWLLDPMVSLCLIGTLIAEATLARYQLRAGQWVRGAKWGLLAATYTMNTWSAWATRDAALIVLHSVPPAVVFVMAEAITDLRDRLTDAVLAAHRYATDRAVAPPVVDDPDTIAVEPPALDEPRAPALTSSDQYRTDEADRTAPAPTAGQRTTDHNDDGTNPAPVRSAPSGPDVSDLLGPGQAVAGRLAAQGQSLSRRSLIAGLREDGHAVSTGRASALLRVLTATSQHIDTDHASNDRQRSPEAA